MILENELSLNDYKTFLDEVFLRLEEVGIDVKSFELDHICYRVKTADRYTFLSELLKNQNVLLGESEINGRPIANFLLNRPMIYKSREISVLEIPAPKKGANYQEGFEHVEFVIDGELGDFIEDNPNVDFDLKGFSKPINRDVRVCFGPISVKFHEQSLREIIAIEQVNQSKAQ